MEGLPTKNKRGCYEVKIKKRQAIMLSFVVGSILFASTAFAEINSKNGYVQIKDALKYTAESFSSKLTSYTVDMSTVMKDNGNIITQDDRLMKYDVAKGATENKSTTLNSGKTSEDYNYSDKTESISFNKEQNVYNVNKYEGENNGASFSDPFKDKQEADMEKIADAIVGNLKDAVVVTENADGTKQLSGTLSEAQIPAIANALVSYGVKGIGNSYNNRIQTDATMPRITQDVYVKEIKGSMTLDKDGLIQSAMGTGLISGKDDKGLVHNLTFELLVKISDVNKTLVNKPDLTGKKVETTIQKDYNKLGKPDMYIGTYKNDIVIEKDGKFQKIGERLVDITSLDDNNIAGRYHEEFTKGNEIDASKAKNFKFIAKFQQQFNANFESTDTLGNNIKGSMWINPNSAEIGLDISGAQDQNILYNGQYSRVFK